jgi:hypothetical protein
MNNALSLRVLEVLSRHAPAHRPNWQSMLGHALDSHPAVFASSAFADHYRQLAADADWFADSLVANACLEGYGSQQILLFANQLSNPVHAQLARWHALDESRHATVFILALDLVFPGLLASQDDSIRAQVRSMQPFMNESDIRHENASLNARGESPAGSQTTHAQPAQPSEVDHSQTLTPEAAIADIIQVHITEIRALVLQELVREAFLRHAPQSNVKRLLRISDQLIADEGRHIAYCADIIEQAATRSADTADQLHEEMAMHMRNFNELTHEELERQSIEI